MPATLENLNVSLPSEPAPFVIPLIASGGPGLRPLKPSGTEPLPGKLSRQPTPKVGRNPDA